jgi:hypothetical protein
MPVDQLFDTSVAQVCDRADLELLRAHDVPDSPGVTVSRLLFADISWLIAPMWPPPDPAPRYGVGWSCAATKATRKVHHNFGQSDASAFSQRRSSHGEGVLGRERCQNHQYCAICGPVAGSSGECRVIRPGLALATNAMLGAATSER